MSIDSLDLLAKAMGNSAQQLVINKASMSSVVAGVATSLWRATGTPAPGAIPTTAAIPTAATTGAFAYNNPAGGLKSYLARASLLSSVSATDIQFHDRLCHMGGLSGIVTTAQTVGLDATDAGLATRKGGADYGDVQWWLEWYTATGSTACTATVTYTNAAGTSGRTTTVSLAATRPAAQMIGIMGASGEFIQSIQSVTLSVSTGTAGNFGVTATRAITTMSLPLASSSVIADWSYLGFPNLPDNTALFMVCFPGSTTTGTLYGSGKIVQG